MLDIVFAVCSALAYGAAPLIYAPALKCTSQFRAMSVFSVYSIALGLLLPWRDVGAEGLLYATAAGLLGGVLGSWLYITSIKTGGPSIGNISSSLYIVLVPVFGGRLWLLPSAAAVLTGVALSSGGRRESWLGGLYGIGAAFVWSFSILLYAAGVESLGPGGALAVRGVVVFVTSLLLSRGQRVCEYFRLFVGGFVDTFLGFGSYTAAVWLGDYARTTLIASAYPLVTSLLDRPWRARRVLGAVAAFLGLAYAVYSYKTSF
ncbi:MAG: EamA family transporter [Pyrobaculum sp.]